MRLAARAAEKAHLTNSSSSAVPAIGRNRGLASIARIGPIRSFPRSANRAIGPVRNPTSMSLCDPSVALTLLGPAEETREYDQLARLAKKEGRPLPEIRQGRVAQTRLGVRRGTGPPATLQACPPPSPSSAAPPGAGRPSGCLTRYRAGACGSGRRARRCGWRPTWRAAAEVRDRLLDGTLAGCFAPGVMTFAKFAQAVLHAAGVPIRPVSRLMKRELVRQIIDQQSARGRLQHFQSIAKTAGLVDLVCEFIGELKRLEIWPEEFHRACAARGAGRQGRRTVRNLRRLSADRCGSTACSTPKGRFWSARDVLQRGERGEGRQGVRESGAGIRNPRSQINSPSSSHPSLLSPFAWSWPTASPTSPARSTKSWRFSPRGRRRCSSRCRWRPSRGGPTCSPNR